MTIFVAESQSVSARLPAFPQGIIPIGWAYMALRFLSVPLFAVGFLIAGLSPVTFNLFSNRRRFERNLPSGVLHAEERVTTLRRLALTTTVLVAFSVAFQVVSVTFGIVVALVAFVLDVVAEWRFRWRNTAGATTLIELDNVHAGCYLQGLLTQNGVDCIIRSFHYRSLFFFLEPIVKMELLVPTGDEQRAKEIAQLDRIKIV